jgi:hypothetical protein
MSNLRVRPVLSISVRPTNLLRNWASCPMSTLPLFNLSPVTRKPLPHVSGGISPAQGRRGRPTDQRLTAHLVTAIYRPEHEALREAGCRGPGVDCAPGRLWSTPHRLTSMVRKIKTAPLWADCRGSEDYGTQPRAGGCTSAFPNESMRRSSDYPWAYRSYLCGAIASLAPASAGSNQLGLELDGDKGPRESRCSCSLLRRGSSERRNRAASQVVGQPTYFRYQHVWP